MKIVMISGNPIGDFYGGVKVHVENLNSYLSNFEDIELISLTFGNKNKTYEKNKIKYIILKRLKFGASIWQKTARRF